MKLVGNLGVGLAVVLCASALVLSVYPGVLNELLIVGILFSILAAPILAASGGIAFVYLRRTGRLSQLTVLPRHAAISLAILVVSYGLLRYYVPRRVAFALSQSSFQAYLDGSVENGTSVTLKTRVGLYFVDEYVTDPRGGTYFRVNSATDGPDVTSYGFCYCPNSTGTPFGAADYRTFRLGNGWYWFRVSDDW
jgi:hypothetical protein